LRPFSSGWGGDYGVDVFHVSPDGSARFDRFLHAHTSAVAVQGNQLSQ
jgi:hypothetical protein